MKTVVFPRIAEDINTLCRTLFHDPRENEYKVGDRLIIVGHEQAVRGAPAISMRSRSTVSG